MSRVSSRRARRMMKQMGLKMDELGDIERVIMQGQSMYQVVGGTVTENAVEGGVEIPEEDILLVAQQAGVSMDKARAALEDAEGDLARAILILTTG